jgi:cell division protein FtsN
MKIIVLVILAATLAVSCNSKKKMYASPFEDEAVEVVVEDRVPERPVQTTQPRTVTQEAPVRVQEERVTLKYGDSMKRYHVIVGSFANEDNAVRLRNRLTAAGYVSIIMMNESNMNRVSIAGFDDELSARDELRRVRPEYHDAWLLVTR